MNIGAQDFEFYTFFTGLKQAELTCLRELLQSFPYYDSHKINVIDQSQAVKAYLESESQKFYCSWRSYLIEPERDLDDVECEQLFSEYADMVNRIIEPEKRFHGQLIDKAMNQYAQSPYVVIMDSDIVFTSDRYLPDMTRLCNRYSYDELAAIGTLYQKRLFHLTLSREVTPGFYHMFMPSQSKHIPWKYVLKTAVKHLFKKPADPKRVNFLGRFPRFHPALLLINRRIFTQYQITFHNLYLDVLDIKDGHETKHKIIGDNGASFLYQCALAGKQIVSIDFEEYIIHRSRVAVADRKAKGWSWFNPEFSDDPLP